MEIDRILEKFQGVCGIADDIVINGENENDHDQNFAKFMKDANEHGLTKNSKKCHVKCLEISLYGNVYTNTEMKPDPRKDLQEMQIPLKRTKL